MKDIVSTTKIKFNNKKVKEKYYDNYIGRLALMCPYCYETHMIDINKKLKMKYHVKYNDNYEIFASTKFNGICKYCHNPVDFIEIDGNIAKTIKILNRKGYNTKFCCEGHDKIKHKKDGISLAYIYFDNGTTYLEFIKNFLPDSWYIDQGELNDGKFIIRAKRNIPLKKRIHDIQKMAEKLDNLMYLLYIK